jgi:hypothetical protein
VSRRMAIPYPPPDPVELAEYLAQYLRREIKAGKFTQADLQDIPEIGCLEQVAAMLKERREEVPRAIADVLGQAAEAGRFLSVDFGLQRHSPTGASTGDHASH